MNLTELLATPVIHLPTAARLGVVVGFATDDKARRISHVIVVDEDSYCRETYYRWQDVRWGQNALLTAAEAVDEHPRRIPFREAVLDLDGVDYGYVKEVACTRNGRIEYVLTTRDEALAPSRLWRVGDVVLLRGKRTPKMAPEPKPERVEGMRRVAGDYSFLLGRQLKSDLIDKGVVVARQGSVITDETIDAARRNGLLVPLTVLSR